MKNKLKLLGVFGIIAILFSFATANAFNNKKTIVIDAGHGGQDLGAQVGGISEKSIVENIAKKISVLNANNDLNIILLRDQNQTMSLQERVEKINKIKPDLLISLHINSSKNKEENGVNAYICEESKFYDQAKENAHFLLEKLTNQNLAKGEVLNGNMLIIKNANCPSILLEIGYLTNENDKKFISSEAGQQEIASRIFEFLKN